MKFLFDQVRLAQPLADNSAESMPSAAARNLRSGGSINKSVSTPHLEQSGLVLSEPSVVATRTEEDPVEVVPRARSVARVPVTTAAPVASTTAAPSAVRKFPHPTGGPQRGLMEKFLASRGRMNSQLVFASVNSHASHFTATSPPPGDAVAVNCNAAAAPQSRSAGSSQKNIRVVNGSTYRTTHQHDSAPVINDHHFAPKSEVSFSYIFRLKKSLTCFSFCRKIAIKRKSMRAGMLPHVATWPRLRKRFRQN